MNFIQKEPRCAVATISSGAVTGNVWFYQAGPASFISLFSVLVFSNTGCSRHGFHIHEFGDLTIGCISAGSHYNPCRKTHGGIDTKIRHAGDLGNIDVDHQGRSKICLTLPFGLTLYGGRSIIGRSIIVHERVDDLGKGSSPESKTTGNSGGRIGCAVIGIAKCDPKVLCQQAGNSCSSLRALCEQRESENCA
ncbi:Superoxide dismutase [Cu-Zn] [Thelohanellus kitauei]|uniref:Superoxide dismutase [Cu-Zn] n=1 Tax=Thelohanellus kitauei TaxID=669202 RepID=A0A0C2N243_THEKT|nr:Superoxide dismutase [Cu-Zn] [Thelohanellus kitauei]